MFILVGCSSTGVVPMDSGTYMIAKRSAQVGFGPPDGVKADVYSELNPNYDIDLFRADFRWTISTH